jgi:hypothetical protein
MVTVLYSIISYFVCLLFLPVFRSILYKIHVPRRVSFIPFLAVFCVQMGKKVVACAISKSKLFRSPASAPWSSHMQINHASVGKTSCQQPYALIALNAAERKISIPVIQLGLQHLFPWKL